MVNIDLYLFTCNFKTNNNFCDKLPQLRFSNKCSQFIIEIYIIHEFFYSYICKTSELHLDKKRPFCSDSLESYKMYKRDLVGIREDNGNF